LSARIAIGQISCESNTFSRFVCDLDTVRRTGYIYEGDEVMALRDKSNEVAGMIATVEGSGHTVVPLLASRWNSSAVVTAECYRHLREHLLAQLQEAGSVDGVLLSCHGSMVVDGVDDPEADLAQAVRRKMGENVPVVMTLDLHGNVTRSMVKNLTAILGYKEYPHDDPFTTGERAARLVLETIARDINPVMAWVRVPMILTAFNASTKGDGPFAQLMNEAKLLERERGIVSTSVQFVGSYIDIPDMGCSTIVITDGDPSRATHEARKLAAKYWSRRREFLVDALSVAEAVARGRRIEGGPIVLLDTADTTGGGAAGDSIDLVRGLLDSNVTEPSLAMVVDPEGVQTCLRAGVGNEVTVELGHRVDPRWGKPAALTGRVLRASDGRFTYTGGIFGGTVGVMGPSVVLQIGSIQLLVQSVPSYDWSDEQYRSVGMNPETAKFVEAKNMMNFRNAYGGVMKGHFVLDLPGPTPADMTSLPFTRAGRPWFPLDAGMLEPEYPAALSSAIHQLN